MQDYERAAADLAALAASLGLSMKCQFVPFSQSRNAAEKWQSLNWRCTIERNGKPVAGLESVDYGQGTAYTPAHKAGAKRFPVKADLARAIALECEKGRRARPGMGRRARPGTGGQPYESRVPIAPPPLVDVLASLCRDSDVLDYSSFEQWAPDLGFDPDSRKAEAIYRLCLAHALALRAAVGDGNLAKMREYAGEM